MVARQGLWVGLGRWWRLVWWGGLATVVVRLVTVVVGLFVGFGYGGVGLIVVVMGRAIRGVMVAVVVEVIERRCAGVGGGGRRCV